MSLARVAFNYVLLTAGECLSKVFTFLAFAYIGRVLGPERYGAIEFTLAVMVFFTLPVDFGLGAYGAREVARDRSRAISLLNDITTLRGLMACASFVALLLFVLLIPKSHELKGMLVLFGFGLFGAPALLQWFFQGHEQMRWIAVVSVVRQGVFAALVAAFLRPGIPLIWIGVFEVTAVFAAAAASLFFLKTRLGGGFPWPRWRSSALFSHFRFAGPIGMAELAWAFLSYFPTVLLGFTLADGDKALGWFSASHRVVMALHTFVWLYFFNLLPSLSRCVPQPKQRVVDLIHASLRITAPLAILGGLLLSALSEQVVGLIYGPAFAGASRLFAVLVWLIPVAMLSGHYRYALLAYNLQARLLYITLAAAAVSVVISFATVPFYGAMGTACGLVAGHVVALVLSYRSVRRRVAQVSLQPQLTGQLLATALFLLCFLALARTGVWMAAIVSALAYLSSLAAAQLRVLGRNP